MSASKFNLLGVKWRARLPEASLWIAWRGSLQTVRRRESSARLLRCSRR